MQRIRVVTRPYYVLPSTSFSYLTRYHEDNRRKFQRRCNPNTHINGSHGPRRARKTIDEGQRSPSADRSGRGREHGGRQVGRWNGLSDFIHSPHDDNNSHACALKPLERASHCLRARLFPLPPSAHVIPAALLGHFGAALRARKRGPTPSRGGGELPARAPNQAEAYVVGSCCVQQGT